MHVGREHVVAAFEAGANGYLVKSVDSETMRQAVKSVARGQSYVCSEVADIVLQHTVGRNTPIFDQLTQREHLRGLGGAHVFASWGLLQQDFSIG